MNEPHDGLAYTTEQMGPNNFAVVQKHGGELSWIGSIRFSSLAEAEGHANSLNYLREKRLEKSDLGKGLHWPRRQQPRR